MLQEKIIAEIKQIPDDKLAEIYGLVHYFRLGLLQEHQSLPIKQRPIGLAKGLFEIPASFFEPLLDDMLDAFKGR
ncbi:hypothetical protein MGMO_106c00060 [Methyloglobulus morosus KoM1]|uniref:DUF2281 domain-containing protein n=1 Tax=Methyloglobulus morosus KoM1 TaxID=1116472 RepID=V5C3E4_9GAMM|nr:hypothetical protein [Methyloglobulus morosus]ESS71343.1 hypothetical protein MGMO_106c00060 [Methyloglobulus morosus KoM1]